jgi:glycosyltransferase involved in cell wall biosynthesis
MKEEPLVTIITIFLNAERFIEEAIESVFNQTYRNWELLLVDDGSTDRSSEIALRYAERDNQRVRYLEHPDHQNRGTGASRNLGIRQARGEYVAFLDSDDVWLPQKLEQQIPNLMAHPEAAMIYEATQFWHSWSNRRVDPHGDRIQRIVVEPNSLVRPPKLVTVFLGDEEAVPTSCSVLLRHNVVECFGGFDGQFGGMYEDQAFYVKVCLQAPVLVGNEFLTKNRMRDDSLCAGTMTSGRYHHERLRFLRWVARYLSEHEVGDAEVWKALRTELWPYCHVSLASALGDVLGPLVAVIGEVLPEAVKGILKKTVLRSFPSTIRREFRKEGVAVLLGESVGKPLQE